MIFRHLSTVQMYPETEQITAERMCYIVNDKDLSQQAKEYFAQIRKTNRLIHRLDSTIATLRSSFHHDQPDS